MPSSCLFLMSLPHVPSSYPVPISRPHIPSPYRNLKIKGVWLKGWACLCKIGHRMRGGCGLPDGLIHSPGDAERSLWSMKPEVSHTCMGLEAKTPSFTYGDKEHLRNSAGLQDLDRNQKGLTENVKQSDKTEQDPSPSKMKIVKSFSEDCPGLSITVTPDTGQKSTGSHPNHLRKFDTIMRSGVNVQELRARFIRQQGNASFEEASKVTELSSSSKQLPQVTHNRMSPRQEALQKLGLLQINQSKINTPEEPHGTDQNSAVKNYEINQNHSKAGSNLSRSLERKPGAFDKVWPP
ncbi:uncharacterized protein LOC130275990 isoform X1 [Hyla sarda]|uniref:uncharacterized protein LOC130275990 isoform X1 n=1 Tax=Hyla sarda TaxID=327740 RepID=UPI0024C27AD8|nr:uncharacterized protein LOC130275990 isoform X1 [Hyla sarda]